MDYVPINEELVFTLQARTRCVNLELVDDDIFEFQESFSIVLITSDSLVQFTSQILTVTVNDDGQGKH